MAIRILSRSISRSPLYIFNNNQKRYFSLTTCRNTSSIQLPGFGLPLNFPASNRVFASALDWDDVEGGSIGRLTTAREITMMQIMNSISEKPDWARKVFDETITTKWREEILSSGRDVSPKMMDWVIKEMQWKAEILKKEGLFHVFDHGVVRSDRAVDEELKQSLREAAAPLENIPQEEKDYHPGSGEKVVNLVHPSLFPVVYGRTRILPDREITRDNCLEAMGQGTILPIPSEDEAGFQDPNVYGGYESWMMKRLRPYSRRFQWMPCDVQLTPNNGCHIESYINSLHPEKHAQLYKVLEKILAKTIPLWDKSLTPTRDGMSQQRIAYHKVEYLLPTTPEPVPKDDKEADSNEFWDRHWDWEVSCGIEQPEPGDFEPPPKPWRGDDVIRLREICAEAGMQVIVKLANIELDPSKPDYEGGSWHIEGQLNERIIATAIYYYDTSNITPSTLSFRSRAHDRDADEIHYEQDKHHFLQEVFGFPPELDGRNDGPITQELGSVQCREGRLLTFPNTLQHRVEPFSLKDRTKPGHRKILALFLVDPYRRVISSGNVPPQRRDWGGGERRKGGMGMEEARGYREQLMEERRAEDGEQNDRFETGSFSLCEH